LIVPVATLPPPQIGQISTNIGIYDSQCNGKNYKTQNITLIGQTNIPINDISSLQFSLTNGSSWNSITQIATINEENSVFNISAVNLNPGNYTANARAVLNNGTIYTSTPCKFNIEQELIFGGNQFVLASRQAPLSRNGIVQFEVREPQTFYLEAQGATKATVRNKSTLEEYPLKFDKSLQLWTTSLVFEKPGTYNLEAFIANDAGDFYSREINTVVVSETPQITDTKTGEVITDAQAAVYVKDPLSGTFTVWNGSTFSIQNPNPIPNGFSVVLPSGEYYVEIASEKYGTVTSLITNVEEQSLVTANIKLTEKGVLETLSGLVTRDDATNNFPLTVKPLPQKSLLRIGEVVPEIIAYDNKGIRKNLYNTTNPEIPTILFIYNNWNTESQEQMDIFKEFIGENFETYNLLPISTMEPNFLNITQIGRGNYNMDFYKPTEDFYDDYSIISLPQFFILNNNQELMGTVVGSQSKKELGQKIKKILSQ
jgi:hypothetical protein